MVTGEASGGGKPGATVNLGSFSYEASDDKEQTVSSVSISVSRPLIFSSITLVATLGGAQAGSVTLTSPIGSTAVFTFLPAIQLPAGSSLSVALSGVIAGGAVGSLDLNNEVRLAGITSFGGSRGAGGDGLLILALSFIGCAILPMTPRQRLRASFVTLAMLTLAVSLVACDNSSGGSSGEAPRPASAQQVVAIGAAESGQPVTVNGLPAGLGRIQKQ
jgi:hypothetical protein